MSITQNFKYRADIDGLRAIAVLAVVLFHADFSFSGGYIGVDVFFVISGYLITSLIWKDLENGNFTFAHFWERRARRIVPPLVVVVIVTLVAGYFILLPEDLKALGQAAVAQTFFAANIYYWFDSGYFSSGAEEKPLLHTWSLAVEEQFYLIVPIVFLIMFRTMRTRRSILIVLFATLIISFAVSVFGVAKSPSATFYLLPTRAWELLMGSVLAFLPTIHFAQKWREVLAVFGLILIFAPMLLYTSETPFPGIAAVPPCFGTALLIWANAKPTFVGLQLSSRPIVFVGLLSYSLYLWHWMFFSFSKYIMIVSVPISQRLVMIGCAFFMAFLSWKYIETPFRTKKIAISRNSVFVYAAIGLIAVLAYGYVYIIKQGFPNRFTLEEQRYAAAALDMTFTVEMTANDVISEKLIKIGASDTLPTVLIWGDSHAMAAMPAFDLLLKEKGIAGRGVTHSATAPVLDWFLPTAKDGMGENAVGYNNAVFSYIQKQKIRDVVLIASWVSYKMRGEENAQSFYPSLITTIKKLTATGVRVWVMKSVPLPSFAVPKILALNVKTPERLEPLYQKTAQSDFDNPTATAIEFAGATILDPKPAFFDYERQHYKISANNFSLYRDGVHLSTKGAEIVLLPFLRRYFDVKTE